MADRIDLTPYTHPAPLVLVISGPSGAGKDVTIKRMKEMGFPFRFVVTVTTRPRRPGEIEGIDYSFVNRAEFERMIAAGELIEYSLVYGEYKGIPKGQVQEALASGVDVVMRVDVQGAAKLRRILPEAVYVFLTAPTEKELIDRLQWRGTETEVALRQRVATAYAELQEMPSFDYVVLNHTGELDCAVQRMLAIVQAEKSRTKPRRIEF